MRHSLLGIRENINSLTQQAELVETSSKNSNAQAQTQNENMLQVAAAMEEMTTQINEVSNNADSAEKSTSSARGNVQNGASVVDSTVNDIRSLTSDIESVSSAVTELAAQTESIGAVLAQRNIQHTMEILQVCFIVVPLTATTPTGFVWNLHNWHRMVSSSRTDTY